MEPSFDSKLTHKAKEILQWLGLTLAITLAYYGSGKLGLLLAVPPGYATSI